MGLFKRGGPPSAEERSTINLSRYAQLWLGEMGGTYTPVPVSTTTALQNAASSACIDTLASSVSSLPLDSVRIVGSTRQPVEPAPSLIAAPSATVSRDAWLYQGMQSVLTDGNAFGEILTYGVGGLPTTIEWLDPALVGTRLVRDDGVPVVYLNGAERELFPFGDIFHVPGPFVKPGSPFADSPVERAKGTIGAAVAAREFGARFFGDGGHPNGIFRADSELSEEQAKGLKRWGLSLTKGNREPLVVGSGISYQPVEVNPEDSQFIDLMRFCVEEACRFWRVPPSMVYGSSSGQNVTYANVSQADLAYLKHSLERHLVRFETALTRLLPRPQFARFNRNAFLRSDPVTRSEVVDRRLRNSTLTVNEARALEDEQPFADPEYDEPGIPGGGDAPDVDDDVSPPPDQRFIFLPSERSQPVGLPSVTVHNHLPELLDEPPVVHVHERQVEPVVNVTVDPTPVTIDNQVTVDPTPVTIDNQVTVDPTPVSIENRVDVAPANVPPAQVTVLTDEAGARFRVKRDSKGRIVEVVEE